MLSDSALHPLIQKIDPHARLLHAWDLKGGISAGMTALEIENPGLAPRRLVVRQPGEAALRRSPHAVEDEFRLLQMIHRLGLPTPAPIYQDPSGETLGTPCLVMGFLEGQPQYAPTNIPHFTRQMAERLAQVHRTAVAQDFSFLPAPSRELGGDFGLPAASRDPFFQVDRLRAILLGAWPVPRPHPTALLHGDYWPGNLLWQGDQLAGVIDWEDAALGDPLADLAVTRLDLLWIIGREAMDTFTSHYLAGAAVDPAYLPFWDLCAALRFARLAGDQLADWAAFFHPYGRADITAETIRAHYTFFVGQALQKISHP